MFENITFNINKHYGDFISDELQFEYKKYINNYKLAVFSNALRYQKRNIAYYPIVQNLKNNLSIILL